MGERTPYTPGTFCWTDLTTSDQDAAKVFYCELFGWQVTDLPVGDGVVYSMMSIDGKNVAAISPQQQAQRDAGVPPAWNSYISVEDADATLETAKALGATVHAPAFDVMSAGRMGVIQDPQGAFFLVWQAKDHIGASLVNAAGALSWDELASPDIDASAGFYSELFGWTTSPIEGAVPYLTIKNSADWYTGGIRPKMEQEPPYWLVYFGTDDVDASLAKVGELGGGQLLPSTDIGMGTIGVAQDPQGAVFALFAGQLEP
jgi:predicted enzyme related to lactoylglutathione lyase